MSTPAPTQRRSGTMFGLVVGLVLGMVIAVLVVPERQDRQVITGTTDQRAVGATGSEVEDDFTLGDPGAPEGGDAAPAAGEAAGGGDTVPGNSSAGGAKSGPDAGAGGAAGTGGAAAPSSGAQQEGPAVQGVTATKIKIGVAVPDLGAIGALGPGYDQGDQKSHAAAVLEGWKRDGRVPIHGRQVEFVYRTYNIIDANAQRAACVGLAQDEKVFMVIAIHSFGTATECVAREFKLPIVTTDGGTDDSYRQAPNKFTLQMSGSRLLRNWIQWAHSRGLLKGKKIGLFYGSDAAAQTSVNQNVKAELSKLGYKPVVEVTTSDTLTGGPQVPVAVQQFRVAGVDLALLLVSSIGQSNFMQQADSQAYKPSYIDNDAGFSTTDTASSTKSANQFAGTFAMTGMRFGEWKSGQGIPAPAKRCQDTIAKVTGKRVDPNERDAEWIAMNEMCDEAEVVHKALVAAGTNLTHQSFVAKLESEIKNMEMGIHANVTFAPGKHHGVDQQRTLQYSGQCRCWKVVTPFSPLFVP